MSYAKILLHKVIDKWVVQYMWYMYLNLCCVIYNNYAYQNDKHQQINNGINSIKSFDSISILRTEVTILLFA